MLMIRSWVEVVDVVEVVWTRRDGGWRARSSIYNSRAPRLASAPARLIRRRTAATMSR
jgi:hypothetical protein